MPVGYSVEGGVALVTLDRPDVLNAFDDEMGHAALDAVRRASADDEARCVVITGAGRAFSSGEDLAALQDHYEKHEAPDLGSILRDRYNPLIRAVRAAPKPCVAAINGVAAGAGASLALACDFRVASEKAKLVLGFANVGLVPDSGAIWFLTKMVGTARAWEIATTSAPLDAHEALRLGLVNRVAPPDEFEYAWRDLAARLAVGPTLAYGLTKSLVELATDRSLHEQLEAEIEAQTKAGSSEDHLEGVQAFLGKRSPRFKGR